MFPVELQTYLIEPTDFHPNQPSVNANIQIKKVLQKHLVE